LAADRPIPGYQQAAVIDDVGHGQSRVGQQRRVDPVDRHRPRFAWHVEEPVIRQQGRGRRLVELRLHSWGKLRLVDQPPAVRQPHLLHAP
jgi:hypothetical protein